MRTSLRPYPAYKETGSDLIGCIPRRWEISRLRHVAQLLVSNVDKHSRDGELPVRLCNYVDVYKNRRITDALRFAPATATPAEIERFRLKLEDVIITKDSEAWDDIGVPSLVACEAPDLICGYHLAILRADDRVLLGRYLFYAQRSVCTSAQYHVSANGVTRYGLTHQAIRDSTLPAPPLDDQAAIARFLANVDNRTGRLIRAKRRLIKLLGEQAQNIVDDTLRQCVGAGGCLEELATGRSTDITGGWPVVRLKYVAGIQTGLTLGKNYSAGELVARPYLRVTNVQSGYLDLSNIAEIQLPLSETAGCQLEEGDVLMTEGGDIDKLGRACVWRGEIDGCLHQNHIFVVRTHRPRLIPEFLVMLTQSRHGRSYFERTAKKTTNLASTNATTLSRFPLPLPTLEEQREILKIHGGRIAALETARGRAQREIDLIHEYRTRLIADVVTGKLDVREVAARLPEPADEPPDETAGSVPDEFEADDGSASGPDELVAATVEDD